MNNHVLFTFFKQGQKIDIVICSIILVTMNQLKKFFINIFFTYCLFYLSSFLLCNSTRTIQGEIYSKYLTLCMLFSIPLLTKVLVLALVQMKLDPYKLFSVHTCICFYLGLANLLLKLILVLNSGYVVGRPINQISNVSLHVGQNLGTRMPVSLSSDMDHP